MTAADKPRADLSAIAVFDAFARLPPGHASLSLFGSQHEQVFRAWAARHGHRVDEQPLANATEGRWTALSVTLAGGYITIHLDSVKEKPEAPEASPCPECDGPADHCPDCGVPNGRPHEAFCHQQPEAAEGSV